MRGAGVPFGNGGSEARDGLVDGAGVVLQMGGHEPKVLRAGMRIVQRKGGLATNSAKPSIKLKAR